MRKPKEAPRLLLIFFFAAFVFGTLVITMLLIGLAVYLLSRFGVLQTPSVGILAAALGIASIVLGTIVAAFVGKIPVKPVSELIEGMNALAAGKYQTRLSLRVPKRGKALEESFNILAEELQNTEMLRSDFVNHFSHEFKTPLVSIQGFARLLQKGNLTVDKQQAYIEIIASESERLAQMATKVLDLTKLENQSILTDVTEYNLSEQLRECILLLERRWTKKELAVSADFSEYRICANQEMLRQVWINLLDNAVKFSPQGGAIGVSVTQDEGRIAVSVTNCGEEIPVEQRERIFQKFYQGDASHTTQGNGIGLAIVRQIVQLHEGEIRVECAQGTTAFIVCLPCE